MFNIKVITSVKIVGYDTVQSVRWVSMSRSSKLPPSSGNVPSKRWECLPNDTVHNPEEPKSLKSLTCFSSKVTVADVGV
jgi:hypothetical protein